MNDILFSKPKTWSGVQRIEVSRWRDDYGFHVTALHLERWRGEKTWRVARPAESAIWTADGRVLRPAKPKVVLADGLTLRQARRFALQTLETEGVPC